MYLLSPLPLSLNQREKTVHSPSPCDGVCLVLCWLVEKEAFLPTSYPGTAAQRNLLCDQHPPGFYGCTGSNWGPFVWRKTWKIWQELKREWLKMISLENGSFEAKLKRFGLFSIKENFPGSEEKGGFYLNVDLNHWAQTLCCFTVWFLGEELCVAYRANSFHFSSSGDMHYTFASRNLFLPHYSSNNKRKWSYILRSR